MKISLLRHRYAMLAALAAVSSFSIPAFSNETNSENLLKFNPPVSYHMGQFPQSVALADLNGDGQLDAIVATRRDNSIAIRLGTANGEFGDPANYATAPEPIFARAADLDNDEIPDLITANYSNSISILPGKGDGTFGEAIDLALDGENRMPINIVAADFNGDSIPDLAVANFLDNSVALFIGKGKLEFADPVFIPAGNGPVSLVSGDFNRDGNADLAIANRRENTARILLGDGNGNFQSSSIEIGERAGFIAAGDLNNDGHLDLAIPTFVDNSISLLIGDGSGNFERRDLDVDIGAPSSLALADLDGDGWLDIVVTCQNLSGVAIFRNSGNGNFATPAGFQTGIAPDAVAMADLNGDSRADIVTADLGTSSISVVLSGGNESALNLDQMGDPPPPAIPAEGNATLVVQFETPDNVPADFETVQVYVLDTQNPSINDAHKFSSREKSFETKFENLPLGHYLVFVFTGARWSDMHDASRPGPFKSSGQIILHEDSATVTHAVRYVPFDANSFKGTAEARGKVLDIEKNPVADLELTARIYEGSAGELKVETVRTNDRGEFLFKNLAEGKTYDAQTASEDIGEIVPGKENILMLPPQVGQAAPEIEFTHLDTGEIRKLSDFRGKVVLLDFWATWCGPCQEPMEKMQHYREKNPDWGDKVELIALSIDDSRKSAERHLEKNGWTKSYNAWAGSGGFRSAPPQKYGITGIPTFYLIDADGKIAATGHPMTVDLPKLINEKLAR